MFYRLLLALDTLSQGLAKLTPGRRDEFETAEIKKSFEGNKKKTKKKNFKRLSAGFVYCGVEWKWNPVGERGGLTRGIPVLRVNFFSGKRKSLNIS